jgi:TPR repeat protein
MTFSRVQTLLVRCFRVVVFTIVVHSVAYSAEDAPQQPNLFQVIGKFFGGKPTPASEPQADTANPPLAQTTKDTRSLPVQPSGKRVALVIGNAAYPGPAALRNPANDATDIVGKLKKLGFDATLKTNVSQKEMLRALTEFGDKVTAGSEALFFYAGHGMQVKGRNYLIPLDAEIRTESSVSSEAVDVDQLLDKLSHARLSMVILDACRNNPFERRFRGGGQGLAQINAPTGTLIAYATAPGKVAADGEGRNGLYTQELLKAMEVPGIKVEDVFKRVRANVVEKSGDAQTPWESSSLTGDFYFIFQEPATVNVQQASTDPETALWAEVKQNGGKEYYEVYLKQYPKGKYAGLAKVELKKIEEQDKSEKVRQEAERKTTEAHELQARLQAEKAAWDAAKAADTVAAYTTFLANYADGRYTSLAEAGKKKAERDLAEQEKREAAQRAQEEKGRWAETERQRLISEREKNRPTRLRVGLVELIASQPKVYPTQTLPNTVSDIPILYGPAAQRLKEKATNEQIKELLIAYQRDAEAGDPVAQYSLGSMYSFGLGVQQSDTESSKWQNKAALAGLAIAQTSLGVLYLNIEKDAAEAAKWFRKAAEQGEAIAQNNLGTAYSQGQGVAKDEAEAVKWYRKASDQGFAGAQNNLGIVYENGHGVAKDEAEAVRWYRKAADQGDVLAQNSLAFMYMNGIGIAKNAAEAVRWYRKAADQGDAASQSNLGIAYANGHGVIKNEAEAVRWFRMAADQGNVAAQNNLGNMYEIGSGVEKDKAEAVKWYRKAADQGDLYAIRSLERLR